MSFKIVSGFTILLVCLSVIAAEGIPREFTLPGLVPCNHTETPGASCVDCSRLLICTKLGGIIVPCWLPGPHCNNGTCSTEPSNECEVATTPSHSLANADSFVLSDSFAPADSLASADSFVQVADPVIESEMSEQNEQPIEVLPYGLPLIRVADNDDDS